MTFTSNIFLIGLLPWFICLYNLLGKEKKIMRIILLCFANSLFYVWGGFGTFVFSCSYSIAIWLFSLLLVKLRNQKILAITITCALMPLLLIKYTNIAISSINAMFNSSITSVSIVVPLGISFYTFEAISFLVDTYKMKIKEKASLLNVYLYLTFFPTVTSGPIIRYDEFHTGLVGKKYTVDYADSIERIAIGLCKKVLISDKIAVLADYYFDGTAVGNGYSSLGLWIGSIAYTLQIYFDFSGYSDMAIGIAQLLGFRVRENFNKPYQARSISDFWKRWHISLTQWFRDYIYIPLGGNRCTILRHIFNMLVVWLITGIWHGADWSFVVWGVGYFILLLAEKYIPQMKRMEENVLGHIYALFFINLLWIPFRSNNLGTAVKYIKGMFCSSTQAIESKVINFIPILVVAALLCLSWNQILFKYADKKWFVILKGVVLITLVFFAICASINSSYTPYIYGIF